jgi:hypothetical protein
MLAALITAVVLAAFQSPFAPGSFEFQRYRSYTGDLAVSDTRER